MKVISVEDLFKMAAESEVTAEQLDSIQKRVEVADRRWESARPRESEILDLAYTI